MPFDSISNVRLQERVPFSGVVLSLLSFLLAEFIATDNGRDVLSHSVLEPRQRNALWSRTGAHNRKSIVEGEKKSVSSDACFCNQLY